MDPCSTVFACFFLFGLLLGIKFVLEKLNSWSSNPGLFRRESKFFAVELLTSLGIIGAVLGGRFLPDVVQGLKAAPMSREQETIWTVIGLVAPIVVTVPLALWFSSKRDK